jgi:hypothetical protein
MKLHDAPNIKLGTIYRWKHAKTKDEMFVIVVGNYGVSEYLVFEALFSDGEVCPLIIDDLEPIDKERV